PGKRSGPSTAKDCIVGGSRAAGLRAPSRPAAAPDRGRDIPVVIHRRPRGEERTFQCRTPTWPWTADDEMGIGDVIKKNQGGKPPARRRPSTRSESKKITSSSWLLSSYLFSWLPR